MAAIKGTLDALASFVISLGDRHGLELGNPALKQHRRQAVGEPKCNRLGNLPSFPVREITARMPYG